MSTLTGVLTCVHKLQAKADPLLRNLDGKTPLDFAEGATALVLVGEFRKSELLEAARTGKEDRLVSLLTPQNVNCHADDGRKSTPLHLAAGYNRQVHCSSFLQPSQSFKHFYRQAANSQQAHTTIGTSTCFVSL